MKNKIFKKILAFTIIACAICMIIAVYGLMGNIVFSDPFHMLLAYSTTTLTIALIIALIMSSNSESEKTE